LKGFELLRTFKLEGCIISGADIDWIVFTSPLLDMLDLVSIQVESNIRICSKGLRILTIFGNFSDFQIDAPNLVGVCIEFCNNMLMSNNMPSQTRVKCINDFCESLGGLSKLRKIGLLRFFNSQYWKPDM
jgi:hypothetical protein